MTLRSKAKNTWVEMTVMDGFVTLEFGVNSEKEAETMIARFHDVMEDFFRVWPELREENENGPI